MEPAPSCAICNAPAYPECRHESDGLKLALDQAEKRAMSQRMHEIRDWVVNQAREQILKRFQHLSSARKAQHATYLAALPYYEIYMQYSGNPPLHPQALHQLQAQIREAHAELKRGVDADWRASVQRYPETLDYFYSMVELKLPTQLSPEAIEPPSFGPSGLFGGSPVQRKKKHRQRELGSPPPARAGGGRPFIEDHPYMVNSHSKAPPVAPHPPSGNYGYGHPGAYR